MGSRNALLATAFFHTRFARQEASRDAWGVRNSRYAVSMLSASAIRIREGSTSGAILAKLPTVAIRSCCLINDRGTKVLVYGRNITRVI